MPGGGRLWNGALIGLTATRKIAQPVKRAKGALLQSSRFIER